VPSGKLRFRRTGTSTAQDTYSDSALSVANSNPVELDATGALTVNVYGTAATGFAYRVQLLTSADVVLWTLDDVSPQIADDALSDNVPLKDEANAFTDAQTITVADSVLGLAVKATTGQIKFLGYHSSFSGAFIQVRNAADNAHQPLQVDASTITLNATVAAGSGTLATNATTGFLYVPTCAGTPTGVPAGVSGYAPIVVNTTNNKLYFYSGGAWRDAGP
jgi:hypothetical protein